MTGPGEGITAGSQIQQDYPGMTWETEDLVAISTVSQAVSSDNVDGGTTKPEIIISSYKYQFIF